MQLSQQPSREEEEEEEEKRRGEEERKRRGRGDTLDRRYTNTSNTCSYQLSSSVRKAKGALYVRHCHTGAGDSETGRRNLPTEGEG